MIVIVLDNTKTELTGDNFAEHVAAIRAAADVSVYRKSVETIVTTVSGWADSWEQKPSEGAVVAGLAELIDAVAELLNLPPGSATAKVERYGEALVDFKQCWVDLSHDNTDGGQTTDSLAVLAVALSDTFDRINENPVMAKFVWGALPGTSEMTVDARQITTQFLANKYECHHNAARDIRKIVQTVNFGEVLAKQGKETDYTKYLVRRWNRLTFASKVH
jgi:hypothetical protein